MQPAAEKSRQINWYRTPIPSLFAAQQLRVVWEEAEWTPAELAELRGLART
jgi:hypothetical protein